MAKSVNHVNVDQLFETIEQIKKQPDLALFKFRVTNKWREGTHNQAQVQGFFGAGKEDETRKPVTFELDEPPILLGNNIGPNPVEYLLVGLSGCLTTALIANASAKGLELRSVSSRLEGDIDLRGFLGISEEVPVGYREIRVEFTIDADIPVEQKEELVRMAKKYSPVTNTILNATPVTVSLRTD